MTGQGSLLDEQKTKQRVAVLGATGSIGASTLDVIRQHPSRFEVAALTAGSNWRALVPLVEEFRPSVIAVADPDSALEIERVRWEMERRPEILVGESAATEVAGLAENDLVVNGVVGSRGLEPTLLALESGTPVAIANKEPLVVAGELVLAAAEAGGAALLPLDSELSAIHQCLRGNTDRSVRRVILTASGGPFRDLDANQLAHVTPAEALEHPTWNMGPKITVDSATLMNKGLEVLETHFYFDMPYERIEVVIHPQSLIHSFVEYVDHSMMAQISTPDMRLPIQYALTYPDRVASALEPVDLVELASLTFEAPDEERFPCLRLAREAGLAGGTAPAVLNASNEVAVEAFLEGEISFSQIPRVIEECLTRCSSSPEPTLANFREADGFTRREARRLVQELSGSPSALGQSA